MTVRGGQESFPFALGPRQGSRGGVEDWKGDKQKPRGAPVLPTRKPALPTPCSAMLGLQDVWAQAG